MRKGLRLTSGLLLAALLAACGSDDDQTVERIERTPDLLIQEEDTPVPTIEPTEAVTPELTVEPTEEATPEATAQPTDSTPSEGLITVPQIEVPIGQIISIYSCPAFTCEIVRDLAAGEEFQFTNPEAGGWFKITLVADGSIGYLPIAAANPNSTSVDVASNTPQNATSGNPIFVPNQQSGGTTYTYVPPPSTYTQTGGNPVQPPSGVLPPSTGYTGSNSVQPPSGVLPPVVSGGGSGNNPVNPNPGQPVIPNDIPPGALPVNNNPPPTEDPTDDLPPDLPSAENPLTNPNPGGGSDSGNNAPPPPSNAVVTPEPVSPQAAPPPSGGGGQIVINPFDPMAAPPPSGGQTGGGVQPVDPMSAPPPPMGQ